MGKESRGKSDARRPFSLYFSARNTLSCLVSLPSLLYMQVLFFVFFPPSLCFSFHWWQTVPPVQFNSYHTLWNTLTHTEAEAEIWWMMEGVRPIKMWQHEETVEERVCMCMQVTESRLNMMAELFVWMQLTAFFCLQALTADNTAVHHWPLGHIFAVFSLQNGNKLSLVLHQCYRVYLTDVSAKRKCDNFPYTWNDLSFNFTWLCFRWAESTNLVNWLVPR